ncbi:MAG: histidine phosphatase family protein [Patescibacteria group bacterium]
MPKKVYLVRHGESTAIAEKKNQDDAAELSAHGITQARATARRFASIPIKSIICSPLLRARQTADIIAREIGVSVGINDLLREIKKPREIEGKLYDDPEVLRIRKILTENHNDPNWHFSDEENLFDLTSRMKQFALALASEPSDQLLIVAHAGVIRMLSLILIFDDLATPDLFHAAYRHMKLTQTGITMFEQEAHGWRLMTWNDYAHLGDDSAEGFHK